MQTRTQFADTLAAVAQCRVTLAEQNRIAAAIGTARPDREQRIAQRSAEAAHDAAARAALTAYADEMLPAVLGGAWQRAAAGSLIPYGRPADREMFGWPLIDHALNFRRTGTSGPLTWAIGVLLAEPYNALDRDGQPLAPALAQARRLRAELGIATWASAPLSWWYPGSTALLILTPNLRPDRAAPAGFTALA